jgi:hypothetical protein
MPTFHQLNNTVSTIEFYAGDITANFAYDEDPGINAGAQDNGSSVYVWEDGDPTAAIWQLRKGGDGMFARIEPVLEQRWYQESQNGNIAVTVAGPYSAQVGATGGWTGDTRSFVFPYEIYKWDCPADTGCQHLIAGSYRVWETILGGTPGSTWYANSPDLTKGTLGRNRRQYGSAEPPDPGCGYGPGRPDDRLRGRRRFRPEHPRHSRSRVHGDL